MSNSAFIKDSNITGVTALTDGSPTLTNAVDINSLTQDSSLDTKDIIFIDVSDNVRKQTSTPANVAYIHAADFSPTSVIELVIAGLDVDCAYEIYFSNLTITSNSELRIQLGDNLGFFIGSSDYAWTSYFQTLSGTNNAGDQWDLSSDHLRILTNFRATTNEAQGFMRFVGLRSGVNALCYNNVVYIDNLNQVLSRRNYGTCLSSTSELDRIRIYNTAGTFSGNFSLYKIEGATLP